MSAEGEEFPLLEAVYFHRHYLYHYILHLFVLQVPPPPIRAIFCYTTPDIA
jgi:hypothetical protein